MSVKALHYVQNSSQNIFMTLLFSGFTSTAYDAEKYQSTVTLINLFVNYENSRKKKKKKSNWVLLKNQNTI